MTDGPRPIADAVALTVARAETRQRIADAWPNAPRCLLDALTRIALNPRATSDALLIVSDGLEEARRAASAADELCAAQGLERLRDLLADAAPARASVPLVDASRTAARQAVRVLRWPGPGAGRRSIDSDPGGDAA